MNTYSVSNVLQFYVVSVTVTSMVLVLFSQID